LDVYDFQPHKSSGVPVKSGESLSDTALLQLITHGDEGAFEVLYHRYKSLVYGLVLNIIGDPFLAEDVTLDVFAQIWRQAFTFQPQLASFKTWVTSIARHRGIDELRRRRSRPHQQISQWAGIEPSTLADSRNMQSQLEDFELQDRVRTAIAALPVEQREILALAYFKGYSHRQIAETVNRPLGTVKTHIRKAMEQLRKTLDRKQ
jgi:RNA polymerase sigma-70 factor (ECF subfamily)